VKVVLREEVDHLGRRGEVVNVARGYARNYLLPKGLAWEATPGNLKTVHLRRKSWEVQEQKDKQVAEALAARLAELSLTTAKKAGETATLYGSVTNTEIAGLLAEQGIEIDRRKIQIREPIKTLGTFEVSIKLHHEVIAKVKLEVTPEAQEGDGEPEVESASAGFDVELPAEETPADSEEATADTDGGGE
jgi:large subunit ribosomal protein L9